MNDLRLTQLRAFVRVAGELHFGRAAEALGTGQSAVSGHVRAVERSVGTPLLVRTSRRVRLTPAGERFLPVAERLLRDLERAAEEARAVAAGELGSVRIAAQQAARALIVPGVWARLHDALPGLDLVLTPAPTAIGIAGVHDGRFDAAFVREPGPQPGLTIEVLCDDPVVVALPLGHPLAGEPSIELEQLVGEPRVGWETGGVTDVHDRFIAALRDAGVGPADVVLPGVDTRLAAVASGLGYALESAAHRWLYAGRIAFVPIAGSPLRGEIAIASPSMGAAPGLAAVIDAARATASDTDVVRNQAT